MADGQSALLIPVPEAEALVGPWRELYDPSAEVGIPAHITVLYPFVPRDDVDDPLLEALTGHFAQVPAFDYRFPKSDRFPGIIYLAPEPAQRFRTIITDITSRYPAYPPYGGDHADVIPHLTVADRRARLDMVLMDRVERGLARGLPFVARAREVWLMTCRRKRWSRRARFPLRAG